MAPESVTVPLVLLVATTLPANTALAVPLCNAKPVLLVSVPLLIVPVPCSVTVPTVSALLPRLKMPVLLTVTAPASASTPPAPSSSVPALTVVPPL